MTRSATALSIATLLGATAVRAAGAQGSLATQGFGYPAGGVSTRSAGSGGALGEFDPLSPLNPAALASWGPTGLYFQFAPEFRTVSVPSGSDHTTTVRFPLLAAAIPLGERLTLGASSTTFLDRTWGTQHTGIERFLDDSVAYQDIFSVNGSINETRVAAAFRISPIFRVGIAGHVFTGSNRMSISRTFADTASKFAAFSQSEIISYSGGAMSVGADLRPLSMIALAATARFGGTFHAFSGDTVLSSAPVPKHYAGSIMFTGLPGTNIGVRAAWDGWSSMTALGDTLVKGVDGWDVSVGGETRGVSVGTTNVPLRLGVRWRTLPFAANGANIKETSVGGGFGIPMASGRANIDVSIQRAMRTGVTDVSERAWLLGFGFTVRP